MAEFQIQHPYHSQGLASGGSALLDAINRGKVHLAKFILDAAEADVVNTKDFNGKTPLIRACYIKEEKTRDKAVNLLIARNADVNRRDDFGRTAFSYACELRCNDIVQILVKNNVDPDVPDNNGNTALMYSCMVGNDTATEIIVRSFRRLGLAINHTNNDGLTALLLAAKNGFIVCASILAIEGRANLSIRDPQTGLTPEELARDRGCSLADVLPFSVTCGNAAAWMHSKAARYQSLIAGNGKDFTGVRARLAPNKLSKTDFDITDEREKLKEKDRGRSLDETTMMRGRSLPSMRVQFREERNSAPPPSTCSNQGCVYLGLQQQEASASETTDIRPGSTEQKIKDQTPAKDWNNFREEKSNVYECLDVVSLSRFSDNNSGSSRQATSSSSSTSTRQSILTTE